MNYHEASALAQWYFIWPQAPSAESRPALFPNVRIACRGLHSAMWPVCLVLLYFVSPTAQRKVPNVV